MKRIHAWVLCSAIACSAQPPGPVGPVAPVGNDGDAAGSASAAVVTASATAGVAGVDSARPAPRAQLDGKDAGYRGIIAKAYGDNELELAFSTKELGCDGDRKAYDAWVTLNRVVQPSGERQWIARQASYANGTKSSDYGPAKVTKGPSGALEIALPKIAIESSKEPKLFELEGTFVAKSCGDVAKNPAPPRPQANAKLTLAGQELSVRGALLRRLASGDELVVSTNPLDCSGEIVQGEDLQVRVQLGKGEAYVSLRGALNGTHTSLTLHKKEQLPALTVGLVKGGVADVKVGLSLERAPKLELSGAVEALVCKD